MTSDRTTVLITYLMGKQSCLQWFIKVALILRPCLRDVYKSIIYLFSQPNYLRTQIHIVEKIVVCAFCTVVLTKKYTTDFIIETSFSGKHQFVMMFSPERKFRKGYKAL